MPQKLRAQQNWQALVGAESKDMGKQAQAFFPNEIWIHAGDSITWTWQSEEIHTLTFLTPGQPYPPFRGPGSGCPGFATVSATFDGTTCVSTPPMVKGQTFQVTFTMPGSYKFECLVHSTMTGVVHVLDASAMLPHNQAFYTKEAAAEQRAVLSDITEKMAVNRGNEDSVWVYPGVAHVTAGIGEISSNPGGLQTGSLVRFVNGTITIHVGDTVEWSNHDPEEPHTITFGTAPADEFDPSANVTIDSDGALHATISSSSDNVNSGFIVQAPPDELGIPQNPIVNPDNPMISVSNVALYNPTRFRVTFTQPGTYAYRCLLHDNLGMEGRVIVVP